MAGLMLVFLAIAIFFMIQVAEDKQAIEEVAKDYAAIRTELFKALEQEFEADKARWGAELEEATLSVRFLLREEEMNSRVFFQAGSPEVSTDGREVLGEFFPRYVGVLMDPRFVDHITEVRIEGHTSSEWKGALDERDAYLRNLELSQGRTRSVLQFVMGLPGVTEHWRTWLLPRLTANGLSYSKPVLKADASEDYSRSRRVEFRVITDAHEQLGAILDLGD